MSIQAPRRPAPLITEAMPTAAAPGALDMLDACHDRMQKQCATLRRLLDHLPRHGADADARQVAANVIRYFDIAAPQHHADEELDLFPSLRTAATAADRDAVSALCARLALEHRDLETRWQPLHAQLLQVAAGEATALRPETVLGFVERTEAHVADEDAHILPLALRLLTTEARADLAAAMRKRRGLD